MESALTFLHLEDNRVDAEFVATMLEEDGIDCEIRRVLARDDYVKQLGEGRFDLIISDYSMPSFDGEEALRLARILAPDTPFIFVSGTIGEEIAVEALKNGAVDYVLKNRLSRFPAAVRRAIEEARQRAERSELQRELVRRDELFRQITENVEDLIAVLDLDGNRVFSSPSYFKVLGDACPREGADSFTDIHPKDRERVRQIVRETVSAGAGLRVEYRLRSREGDIRYVESQSGVIRDAEGRVINVVMVSRDVTEARGFLARLREQARLLDLAQDAIFVRDREQKVTYWNRGAERLYGWSAEEIIGRLASELLYRSDAPRRDDIWSLLVEQGEWSGELRQVTKSGRDLIVVSRRTLLRNESGEPTGVMNINTDVTEQRDLEEKLLRSQRLETIGSLAGGIAHDLNNVLAPVLMMADLLQEEHKGSSEWGMLETVRTSARRGSELVKQILSFAHGVSNEPMALQLRHLIRDMIKLMQDTFPRSIRFEFHLAADLWTVRGDPTQLHQVLLNLCVNARDAMPDGGLLTIAARNVKPGDGSPSSHCVVLEVSDTGEGISDDVAGSIFEPFFSTKAADKGTGLGLPTVARIVKSHGGVIEFDSQVGAGTTFRVLFPACVDDVEGDEAPRVLTPSRGNGERILLVDDEQAVLLMTKGTLEAYNYQVTVARNGLEALTTYRREGGGFDLVITDSMMPSMDGRTLTRYLHAMNPAVKVVAISGLAESDTFSAAQPGVVKASLRKPYEGSELLLIIQKVLSGEAAD